MSDIERVIFACVHNAGRSQIAAAFFNQLVDPSVARAVSAGTQPGTRVHPEVVVAMNEVGVDLSGATPQRLTDELAAGARLLVTMGCGDACPNVPGLQHHDWPLQDPKGQSVDRVREIRDEIRGRVLELAAARHWKLKHWRSATMPKIEVYDPAMCCATGVCGPKIDPNLARFASDLEALKRAGAMVTRYNLSQQPSAFLDNETVVTAMRERGECLPLILVDGRIVSENSYPTRDALASFAGMVLTVEG